MKRKIVEIDEALCDGCGQCATACAEGAIEIREGKAKLVADFYCDGLGACLGHCPKGAINIIEREANGFDESAVSERLRELGRPELPHAQTHRAASEIGNWPVQIALVSPAAPYLKGADVLVAADCTAFAYGAFHAEMLKGKPLLIGCPKLDNSQAHFEKLTAIFTVSKPRSVSVVVMEVPCCQMMPRLVEAALKEAGLDIKPKVTVLGIKGEVKQ